MWEFWFNKPLKIIIFLPTFQQISNYRFSLIRSWDFLSQVGILHWKENFIFFFHFLAINLYIAVTLHLHEHICCLIMCYDRLSVLISYFTCSFFKPVIKIDPSATKLLTEYVWVKMLLINFPRIFHIVSSQENCSRRNNFLYVWSGV